MDFILDILYSFLNHPERKKLPICEGVLWKHPHSKELTPANSHMNELDNCSSNSPLPRWAFRWDYNLVNNLIAAPLEIFSQRHLAKPFPNFSPTKIMGW